MKYLYIIVLSILLVNCKSEKVLDMPLQGEWHVAMPSTKQAEMPEWTNRDFNTAMQLPGSTDMAGLGNPDTLSLAIKKPQILYLTRKFEYVGPAYYTRTIKVPQAFKKGHAILTLERVLWTSDVWIDGKKVTSDDYNTLSSPHRYDLTSYLKPGENQRLTIRIDNRRNINIGSPHAFTKESQTYWNGILGDLSISFEPSAYISNLAIYPDVQTKSVKTNIVISSDNEYRNAELLIKVSSKSTSQVQQCTMKSIRLHKGENTITTDMILGDSVKLWNELTPNLYSISAHLKTSGGISEKIEDFGMRNLSSNGKQILLNGKAIFLRGTLECCVFPLTGCPPTDQKGWEKVIKTAKEWGLNHLRFHSWCPPKAAFQVADREGFYLQVELPVWTNKLSKDSTTIKYLMAEGRRIIKEYGNHPSFCFFSMGNELEADLKVPNNMMNEFKQLDGRHLYTTTSFTFEKNYFGRNAGNGDDYLITQWTNDGWVRGQGVFNNEYPSFNKNYDSSVKNMTIPIITHEVGQYSVYPNMDEIKKYTGVLRPLNFESVRADLTKKGLLSRASEYTRASGKLAAILYKEEIERAIKTSGISGYQLLDLHDFPGQGTALVGLLDAFWDSKGIISAESFREFTSPVVPLAKFEKAIYNNDEKFKASIDISNYALSPLMNKTLEWNISHCNGIKIDGGSQTINADLGYNAGISGISSDLSSIARPEKLTLTISIKDTPYKNHWNIWVYPKSEKMDERGIFFTSDWNEALQRLKKGEKVLYNPDWKNINGIEGKFTSVFWSPVHFPKQAGTMGITCDKLSPALQDFPNDGYTDWQWWDLCTNSTTMIVDSIKGGSPIVELVDNFTNNRRLAMIYEGKIGKGRLVIASCDLHSDLDKHPAARQMRLSLIKYMQSDAFNPIPITNPEMMGTMIKMNANAKKSDATGVY
jgi:hypothetical protein